MDTDEDGTSRCRDCGAEQLWDEGLVLSTTWAVAEIKRLRRRLREGESNASG